ncbi:hypothetical protein [Deinococcus yunweiensis]|uniref:hypothetical protein n=1 Tax=Deinococcus yunweiensis TaxID=367282 RepID=UPI00398ECE29
MIPEHELVAFTRPASLTEEQRCDRATRMVREAMSEDPGVAQRRRRVFAQGSYPNNTNARQNSDVDICVILEDVHWCNFEDSPGESLESCDYTPTTAVFADDRHLVHLALIRKFGADHITPGKKAFDVHSVVGSRVDADVVPAWRFRAFHGRDTRGQPLSVDGVTFWSTDGRQIINFPEHHLENGASKNTRTNGYFKSAARILKHVRYDMLDDKLPVADGVSSFLLESLLYNLSDGVFMGYASWQDRMQNLLYHMHDALNTGVAEREWVEVSGCKWVFRPTYSLAANWTPEQARAFVLAAYARIVG